MALVAKATPKFARKNFQLHVEMLRQGRRRPLSPLDPTYKAWCRIVPLLKARLTYRAEMERGLDFDFTQDASFVDEEIERLYLHSCSDGETKINLYNMRFFLQGLDPFALDSQVQALFDEADTDHDGVVDVHDVRAAVVWALDKCHVMARSDFTERLKERVGTSASVQFLSQTEVTHAESVDCSTVLDGSTREWDHEFSGRGSERDATSVGGHRRGEQGSHATLSPRPLLSRRLSRGIQGGDARGGITWHKATALSLASNKVPLIRCLLKPHDALRKTRGEMTEDEIAAAAAAKEEAERLAEALRLQEEASRHRLRIPSRDRNGRTITKESVSGRVAKEVLGSDPRQVNLSLLRTGPNKANVRAFLASKELQRKREREQQEKQREKEESRLREEEGMPEASSSREVSREHPVGCEGVGEAVGELDATGSELGPRSEVSKSEGLVDSGDGVAVSANAEWNPEQQVERED